MPSPACRPPPWSPGRCIPTSDFGIILGDTVGRTLRAAYQAAPSGIRQLGRQTSARDFRAVNKIMLGEAPLLEKLGETNSGNGPKLSDNKPLFHADHGNKAGSGATISDTTLSAARLALRTQKGIEDRIIRVTPKYLLVPPTQETDAERWLASVAAAKATDVNPFAGSLTMVVEPRLSSASRWYVTADPAEIDGLEFASLSGAEGPQVESKSGWDVDGIEIRVILDFGAGFVDHWDWYANAGAA